MQRRQFAIGMGSAALGASLGGFARGHTLVKGSPEALAAEAKAKADAAQAVVSQAALAKATAAQAEVAGQAWTAANGPLAHLLGRSDALLVQRGGQTVFEAYGKDHGPTVRHVSWSMAKSITHALVGCAVAQGQVDIDKPLTVAPNADRRLTLRALITLTDGLKWTDGSYSPVDSDATKMLYGVGRMDGAAYVAAKPQEAPPGARWNYSTGAFQLAAAELCAHLFPDASRPADKRAAMAGWIKTSLFEPTGMTGAVAEFDPAGTFYGGSLVYATARDYARFGELYRNDGVAAGRRLLPQGWVKFARTPTRSPIYGAGFWLEANTTGKDRSLLGGKGPMDAFAAEGHAGQVILIVPSKALTLVRLGLAADDPQQWAALGDWLVPIVNAFPNA
jgi:CubicO group peptidase (beta-lactamase class C family)